MKELETYITGISESSHSKSIKNLLIDSNSDKQSGHRYGFLYDLLFTKVFHAKGEGLKILEIGVSEYGEGSLKAYALSDMVSTAVGVDITPYLGEMLENMRFYNLNAYSKEAIRFLKDKENKFDIIIDDGSHSYEHQTFFLDEYVKLLSGDGLLICEDINLLQVINEQAARDDVFLFDGTGNLELNTKTFTDPKLYQHNERIIVKSKSEKLTDTRIHDTKPHIPRLPIVPFKNYKRHSRELAISVPLYHPDFPDASKYNPDNFRSVHCKGAIWAAMSMIHNTDLGENGVPLYFHIEDKVWDDAMPVFRDFGVPVEWCRKMTLPKPTLNLVADKAQYGKSLMCLIDESIDADVTMILDSDFFTCVPGEKMKLYDRLTLPLLKSQPSMTYFERRDLPFWWWVSVVMASACLPVSLLQEQPLGLIEQMGYKALGFEKEKIETAGSHEKVNRYFADEYLKTFPRSHPARDFAVGLIPQCYTPCYAFSIWAEYNQPIVELDKILKIPVYDWEKDYIPAKRGDHCFAHIRVEAGRNAKFTMPSKIHQYWDRFFSNVSRHIL